MADVLKESATSIAQGMIPDTSAASLASTVKTAVNIGTVLGTVMGTLPKAVLFVPKITSMTDLDPSAAVSKLAGAAAKKLGGNIGDDIKSMASQDLLELRGLVAMKKKSAKSGFKGVAQKAMQVLGDPNAADKAEISAMSTTLRTGLAARNYVAMTMQYNPSTIRLRSMGGEMLSNSGATDNGRKIKTNEHPRTNLSAQLVFQDISASDAFWYEGMNVARVINTGAAVAKTVFSEGYSVQAPVEALLSLLHFKNSKQVIFYWSQMFFHGELTSVNANYTMFNKLGNPIKATVDIEIQQPDKTAEFISDDKAWDQAFDMAFGDAGVGSVTKMNIF